MRYAIAIVVAVASLSIGIYGWRGILAMWRSGEARLLFDLRRLFAGSAAAVDRGKQAVSFWILMIINIFVATIFTGFALGVLFLVAGSVAALPLR